MDLQRSILDRAVEDYTGLWELIDDPETSSPRRSPAEVHAGINTAVAQLLERGWIALYRGVSFDGDQHVVTKAANDILNARRNWSPPEGDEEHFRIAATPQGERAYYAGTQT